MADTGIRAGEAALGRVLTLHMDPGTNVLKDLQVVLEPSATISGPAVWCGKSSVIRAAQRAPNSNQGPFAYANRVFVAKDEVMELLSLTGGATVPDDGGDMVHGHLVIS